MTRRQILTPEARRYCEAVLNEKPREELVVVLESLGIACYDDEPTSDLVAAAVDSIEAGDIEMEWGYSAARGYGRAAETAWLDMDEVWQEKE